MKKIIIIAGVVVLALAGWMLFNREEEPIVQVSSNIIGQWQNLEYKMLVREFKDGGVVTDWIDGAEASTGTWGLFTSADAPENLLSNNDDEAVYLQMNLTGKELDTLYFTVSEVDSEILELRYLGPGGTMEFTRVVAE